MGGTTGSGGGGGGKIQVPAELHVHRFFGHVFCVLNVAHGAAGVGGGGGGVGGGGGGGPGLMLLTMHAIAVGDFRHPPCTCFSVLNQQSPPLNIPAAQPGRFEHSMQQISLVAAGAI